MENNSSNIIRQPLLQQCTVSRSTFYQGDCKEVLPMLPSKSVDAIIADLPYGTTQCKWDAVIPFNILWSEYNRIIKPNGAIVLFGREPFTSVMITSNIKNYKHKWVWNKKQSGSAINAKYMPLQIDEDVVVFSNGKCNYYPIMRKGKFRKRGGYKKGNGIMGKMQDGFQNYSDLYYPVNIYEYANPRRNKLHPTEKPVELMKMLVKTYSKEGDIVLDNTMGSAPTSIACEELKRYFIGIENDVEHYATAVSRVSAYCG